MGVLNNTISLFEYCQLKNDTSLSYTMQMNQNWTILVQKYVPVLANTEMFQYLIYDLKKTFLLFLHNKINLLRKKVISESFFK